VTIARFIEVSELFLDLRGSGLQEEARFEAILEAKDSGRTGFVEFGGQHEL